MLDCIERVRRLSVYDEWPSCDFCTKPFSAGFNFYTKEEGHLDILHVCDECLTKAKKDKVGWIRN